MNIIVTGAGKGIGLELVKLLSADPGNKVLGISRDVRALQSLPDNVIAWSFDLTKLPSVDLTDIVEVSLGGEVDVLINNAGFLVNKPYSELSTLDFDRMMTVNLKAPHLMIQQLLPYFKKGTHIVNISSMGGFAGSAKFPGLSLYSTFKGALCTLTECLAEEFKEREIAVNALCLGAVQTEMFQEAFPGFKAPVTALEIAEYIAGFALNGAKYFNGKVIPVSSSTP